MRWTLLGKIAGDLFFVNLSFSAAFFLRFWGTIPVQNWQAYAKVMPWITLAVERPANSFSYAESDVNEG